MKSPVYFAALAGLVAAAAGGWWLGSRGHASGGGLPESSQINGAPRVAGAPMAAAASAAAGGAARVQETPAANKDEAAAQMARALRTNDPILRSRRFLDVLALMTPENGQIYLDGWLKYISENRQPMDLAPVFNRRIGQVYGKVVMGNRKGTPGEIQRARKKEAIRDQFLGWMDTDPAAAKAWLDGHTNEPFREALIGTWLESVADKNPGAAAAWLRTVPEDLQGQYVEQMVTGLRESKSAQEIGDWFAGIASENAESRSAAWLRTGWDTLMHSVTETREPGPEAARLFEQHAGQPYVDASWGPRVAGKYAATDLPNGLAWTLRMAARPEVSDRQGLLASAAGAVPEEKLAGAVASCQEAADSLARDTLLGMLAVRLNETDPAGAAAAVEKIKDPGRRPELPAAGSR